MRPVDKGDAPQVFRNYQSAKPFLTNRLGTYCSYCERRIATNLAVEHIQPKDDALPYTHLENEWTNFLLACVNCNSAKLNKDVNLGQYLLPDRDNTFPYYKYLETGIVEADSENDGIKRLAKNTLDLVALNKHEHPKWDEDIMFSALERFGQRVQVFIQAKDARQDYDNGDVIVGRIAAEAASSGFFSIWMKAFEGVPLVRRALIAIFANTATDCFDVHTTEPIKPRIANTLANSGKG